MRNKLLLILFLILAQNLMGQVSNPDSLFSEVKSLAEKNKYKEAIAMLDGLQSHYPENRDYSDYLSALYLWSGSSQKAKEVLLKARTPEELSEDNLNLLIRIEFDLKSWAEVIQYANLGLNHFPNSKNHYYYQKALAFEQLNEDQKALEQLDQIPRTDPEYKAVDYLRTLILKKQKNLVSAGYLLTAFDQSAFDLQQIGFVEYARKVNTNTYVLRANYANMFDKHAFQVETDAYIKIKKMNYLYANFGISEKKSIFPQVRAGLEFYHEHKYLSASLGARYLYFGKQNDPLLVTGHIGVQSSGGWGVNYRPFISFLDNSKTLASHLVYVRKAFPDKESYIQLDLQYGNLPYFYLTSDVLSRLKAYRVGINTRLRIKHNWFIQPIFMFEYEEYIPKTYRNRYTFQLILSFRF